MATDVREAKRRLWADVVVLVAATYALVSTVWAPPAAMVAEGNPVENVPWLVAAHGLAGVLSFGGLAAAFRWPRVGRALVATGGVLLLSGLLVLDELTAVALVSLAVPGLVLLAAAPFVGPMPSPEEEGKAR